MYACLAPVSLSTASCKSQMIVSPLNITPKTPPQFLVKSDRVKVVVMFNGDNVICDLQEAVDKESGQRQAYIMNYPYKVEYDQPKLDSTGIAVSYTHF